MDDIFHYLYVKFYYISGFSGYSAPVSAKNHKNIEKKKKTIFKWNLTSTLIENFMFGHLGGLHVVAVGLKFESKHGGASHLPMPSLKPTTLIN